MSLQIYVEQAPKNTTVINDVRVAFRRVQLSPTKTTLKILHEIERGEYLDGQFYKDRYGCKLPLDDMSEGCKAALCVEYYPDKIINTIECGSNAISTIISTFTTGAILIRHPVSLSLSNEHIDVSCNEYIFSRGVDLVYYLDNEYPFPKGSFDRRML